MIKWTQNPKYYLNTEENLIYRWFVRKDKLGPHDIKIHNPLPKDWWYSDKAFREYPDKDLLILLALFYRANPKKVI